MAAADPSKSPKREKTPVEEVETSGEQAEVAGSGSSLEQKDEPTCDKPADTPVDELGVDSEVSVEPGAAGADKTTCSSPPEDQTADEKMAEAVGERRQAFDWSEAEDDEEAAKTTREENNKSDLSNVSETAEKVKPDRAFEDDAEKSVDTKNSHSDESCKEKSQVQDLGGEVDLMEEMIEDDDEDDGDEEETDPTAKQKTFCLVCKDCGKSFKRREMYNLHRHFHAHEDEFTPLTCKECGLTFQQRSSFIKHRNEHREKEERLMTPKMESHTTEEGRYQCAECEKIFPTVGKLRDHGCCNLAEKPYHCTLCRQDFQFKVSISKHMMTHSQEGMFKCQECTLTFRTAMALRFHQKSHTGLKPYECPECGMVFKHYSVMEDHRRKHVDKSRSHLCTICGKAFKYSSLLHQHQYLHTGQKPFCCPECGKKFAFAQNMKAHCRQHRLRETNSLSEPPSKPATEDAKGPGKENTSTAEEPKRTFTCPLCPQTFPSAANLRAHMLIHEAEYEKMERKPQSPKELNKTWDKGHACPHCPSVYREESSLNLHLLNFHKSPKKYLERLSAKPKNDFAPLSSDDMQEKWKSEETSIKSYKCSECGKSFRHRSVLELHMRIHSKDKPYQCKVCGKGFRFGSYLQQHLIIHTGEKPYKCPDCGKDFAFLQNMRTHQRLHQEKPFRCTSCRKGYSDETQLQQHMLSHNGDKPHKCDLCDKSFGLAYLLRDHMNTHTGERPHRCDQCNKTFSWFSSLLVHQKIHTRKKQLYSPHNSIPVSTGVRGGEKREGGLTWSLSRPLGGSGMSTQQPLYPLSPQKDADIHRKPLHPQSSMLQSHMNLQSRQQGEQWPSEPQPQPVQWKVDGGEVMPVPTPQQQHGAPQTPFDCPTQPQQHHQRSPGWAEIPLLTQSGSVTVQTSDSHMNENKSSAGSSQMPKKSSPSAVSEMVQQRPQKPTWNSTPASLALASTSAAQHDFSVPSTFMDGAALWSVRPAPLVNSQSSLNKLGQELQLPRWQSAIVPSQKEPPTPTNKEERPWDVSSSQVISSTVMQPEKPWNSCEPQKLWASGLAGVSSSAQINQSNAMPISTPVSHGVTNTLWDIHTPPSIPKTINSTEKLVNSQDFHLQQKQVSPAWGNMQTATQKVPISIQYETHRFGQAMGTPVWGFQNNPVSSQTLLSSQLKTSGGQELQQQPMVTGTQIIINQPSPFFSPPLAPLPPPLGMPGPHPLHSVAVGTVGALSRPPHPNIFFTPQAVMSERPRMPQTLPLPQFPPQTEPHKLGSRLPFAPERLLQCMICRCSFSRELDLQMHYLQHAQGEM
uniref:Zgc:66448 n=1 Tax=Nothobranchius furzeri TaxID=105023 RepID=A0A1A8UQY1_NOTFU